MTGLTPSLSPSLEDFMNDFFGEDLVKVSFLFPGELERGRGLVFASFVDPSLVLGVCVTRIAVRLASALPRRD